jgi:uncharacterized membrane protein YedE/YeeE
MITQFTPLASTIGGVLIGVAAVMLMAFSGRIAGISGILGRLFHPYADADPGGAAFFVLGLVAAPLVYTAVTGATFAQTVSDNTSLVAIAGLRGHGVCGLARLSLRSLVATAIFMSSAFATVFVMRHVVGA